MSKQWTPNKFRHLETTIKEFQEDLEKKLDDRDGWLPNDKNGTPEINGEKAIVPEYDHS
jgi:hypothetical protein